MVTLARNLEALLQFDPFKDDSPQNPNLPIYSQSVLNALEKVRAANNQLVIYEGEGFRALPAMEVVDVIQNLQRSIGVHNSLEIAQDELDFHKSSAEAISLAGISSFCEAVLALSNACLILKNGMLAIDINEVELCGTYLSIYMRLIENHDTTNKFILLKKYHGKAGGQKGGKKSAERHKGMRAVSRRLMLESFDKNNKQKVNDLALHAIGAIQKDILENGAAEYGLDSPPAEETAKEYARQLRREGLLPESVSKN